MTIAELVTTLKENDNFMLLTHTRPDGDTLGSAVALCHALRRMGKMADLFPNPEITDSFRPFVKDYLATQELSDTFNISIDTASEDMLPVGFFGEVMACVDHHASNTLYAQETLLDTSKSACGEIIVQIIEELCGNLEPEEAEPLYIAVSTDTGCFVYANTTPDSLRCAAHLIECGANNGKLNKLLFRSNSFARIKITGMLYLNMKSYADGKINVAVITLDMMDEAGATENDCDDLASLAGNVAGNVVAITVREISKNSCKASVRTNQTVNANAICAAFGGGGHPMASGCRADLPPEEFAKQLAEEAIKALG